MNLLHREPGLLPEADLAFSQTLADVATIGILAERAIRRSGMVSEQPQSAPTNRVVIEWGRPNRHLATIVTPVDPWAGIWLRRLARAAPCWAAGERAGHVSPQRGSGSTVTSVIHEIDELHQHGQVCRRVEGLAAPVEQWRARIRAAARRDGLQIRTFVIDIGDSDAGNLTEQLVVAVRTDHDVDLRELVAAGDDVAELPGWQHDLGVRADVTSLADERARRSRHPCRGGPDPTGDDPQPC